MRVTKLETLWLRKQPRLVFLGSQVDDFTADAVVSQLLLLDTVDPDKDIKLFINSPGGSVTAGMGIYDAMMMCRADVSTVCFGLAASMGAFILGAGTKGNRNLPSLAGGRRLLLPRHCSTCRPTASPR